jgi:hypothetical protein
LLYQSHNRLTLDLTEASLDQACGQLLEIIHQWVENNFQPLLEVRKINEPGSIDHRGSLFGKIDLPRWREQSTVQQQKLDPPQMWDVIIDRANTRDRQRGGMLPQTSSNQNPFAKAIINAGATVGDNHTPSLDDIDDDDDDDDDDHEIANTFDPNIKLPPADPDHHFDFYN